MATIKSKQLNPNLTGSFAVSGSFDVTGPLTATTFIGMLSSSAQIADNISGSLGSNADLIRSLTSTGVSGSLGSNADLIRSLTSTGVSGSFTSVSESLASRISAGEAGNITSVTAGTGLSGGGTSGGITLDVDFSELTDETPTFAGLTIEGDLTARSYIISSSVTHLTQSFSSGSTIFGDTVDDVHEFIGNTISGSATSTGSFGSLVTTRDGRIIGNMTQIIRVTVQSTDQGNKYVFLGDLAPDLNVSEGKTYRFDQSHPTNNNHPFRFSIVENGTWGGGSAYTTGVTVVGQPGTGSAYTEIQITKDTPNHLYYYCTQHANMGIYNDKAAKLLKNDLNNLHRISGSSDSTGSFGRLEVANVSATLLTGTFEGALSSSAQISSDISGSFTAPSASISDRLTTAESELSNTLISSSAQIATDISGSLGENADLIRSLTAQTISGSAGYTSTLTAAGISGSFQHGGFEFSVVSGSATSTGSFGRVEVDVIEAKRFIVSSSVSNITTVDISGSTQFGDTADDRHQFTGSIFIQSGSISQELYAVTNNDRMFFGRFTGGIPVSGSDNISRFATDGDGNIVDVGFTSLDEDENLVLTTVGDGLHVDDVNYWYNNKLFRMGKGAELDGANFRGLNSEYVHFDTNNIKIKGDLIATTGSFQGEMYVKSPDNKSMYIGKNSTGIPVSGSENISRYVTGSGGGTFDIGFTTVDETGEVVFTTAGDGIYVDDNNYWYTTGHFKVGDSDNFINWNTSNLNISGTFTGDGSGLTGIDAASIPAGTVSSSAQIASDISGSFTSVSSSLAARITVEEAEAGGGGSFTAAGISGSFQGGGSNIISGSAVSTGSFGNVQADTIVVDSGANPSIDIRNNGRLRIMRASTGQNYLQMYADSNGFNYIEFYNGALRFAPGGGTKAIIHTNGHWGINTTTDAGYWLDVSGTGRFSDTLEATNFSGSAASTGSFGSLVVDGASLDFSNVPTSDPGIAGRVWRDGTDLKISVG